MAAPTYDSEWGFVVLYRCVKVIKCRIILRQPAEKLKTAQRCDTTLGQFHFLCRAEQRDPPDETTKTIRGNNAYMYRNSSQETPVILSFQLRLAPARPRLAPINWRTKKPFPSLVPLAEGEDHKKGGIGLPLGGLGAAWCWCVEHPMIHSDAQVG